MKAETADRVPSDTALEKSTKMASGHEEVGIGEYTSEVLFRDSGFNDPSESLSMSSIDQRFDQFEIARWRRFAVIF